MHDINDPTISIKPTRSNKSKKAKVASAIPNSGSLIAQISLYATFVAVTLLVGWGAWSYLKSPAAVDDGESITDLEGFDSAPPFQETPALGDSSTIGVTEGGSRDSHHLAGSTTTSPASPNSLLITKPAESADVWLTGTIEDSEQTERIELPERLSGSPNETLILR